MDQMLTVESGVRAVAAGDQIRESRTDSARSKRSYWVGVIPRPAGHPPGTPARLAGNSTAGYKPRDSRREERQHLFSYRESLPEARNHGQNASRVSRPPTPAPPIFITHRNQQAEYPATRETAHLHGIALDPGGAGVVAAGLVDGGEGVLGNSQLYDRGFQAGMPWARMRTTRRPPMECTLCRRSANSLGGRSRYSAPGPGVDGAAAAFLSSIVWGHQCAGMGSSDAPRPGPGQAGGLPVFPA